MAGTREGPGPCPALSTEAEAPLPSVHFWVPSVLASVPGRKERWAGGCGVWGSLLVWPKAVSSHFGARGFLSYKMGFLISVLKCIRESAGLKMTKNSSQEYSIPYLWAGKTEMLPGPAGAFSANS